MAWPVAADFAAPPDDAQRARWSDADRAARPARLARLRARFADAGVDAYFGVRSEHTRYLTGLAFEDGEDRVAGASGKFLVGGDEVVLLADSRYTIQARREAPDTRLGRGLRQPRGALAATWSARSGRAASRSRPASSRRRRGRGSRRRPRTSSWYPSRAGWRRTAPPRSPPSWNASRRPAPSPIARWRRCCPRSGPA